MTLKHIPADNEQTLLNLCRVVFPDKRCELTSALLASVASALPEDIQHSLFGDVLELAGVDLPAHEIEKGVTEYLARATHTRLRPIQHSFTGYVPMVRVRLPDERRDIHTRIGTVYAGDHLLYTVPLLVEKYQDMLPVEPRRVDLITPPRWLGARFGAMSIYLLYASEDDTEHFAFVLEAGMATGESVMTYFGTHGEEITRRSWYTPTPFSPSSEVFVAVVDENSDLREVGTRIGVYDSMLDAIDNPQGKLKLEIDLHCQPISGDTINIPSAKLASMLTVEAAMRVATIGEEMGHPLPGVPEWLAKALAAAGRKLSWTQRPTHG